MKEPHHGVVAVTGYEDTLEVFKDATLWSNCVAVGGPFPPLPFTPEGDDISAQIDAHRTQMPLHEHMVAMDPPNHTRARSLLDPPADPEQAQGQPGLPLGTRRQPARRVRRRGRVRVPHRVLEAVLAVGNCRSVGRSSRGPSGVPRRVGEPAPDGKHRRRRRGDQPAGVPRREVQRLHRGAARRAARRRADRAWRRPPTRTGRCPPSPTWCAPPPSCSVPARRRRPSCWVPHCGSSATVQTFSRRCVTTQARSPFSSRRRCGWRARSRPNSGWRCGRPVVGGSRHSRGHDGDDLRRGREPRS